MLYFLSGGIPMSDFAYAYFNSELENLDIPSLEGIYEKVQLLLAKKRSDQNGSNINQAEVDRINAVYDKIPQEEQLAAAHSSMRTMWEAVAHKVGMSDKEGVLKVNLVLLIVRVVNKFTVACNCKITGLIPCICNLSAPYLIGSVLGHIVGCFSLDIGIFRGNNGISGTMAAFALVLI